MRLRFLKLCTLGQDRFVPQGLYLNKRASPGSKNAPCQITMHSCQWLKLLHKNYVPLGYGHMCPQGLHVHVYICLNLNFYVPKMLHVTSNCIPYSGSREDDFLSFWLYIHMPI